MVAFMYLNLCMHQPKDLHLLLLVCVAASL